MSVMAVVTRTLTMVDTCKCCKQRNELSAQDLTRTGTPVMGRTRYFKYSCKHCGEKNYIYSREISIHILRELKEM